MKAAQQPLPENVVPLPQRKRSAPIVSGRFKVIAFTNNSGTESWRVSGYKRDGERVRENFANEPAARCRHIELETEYLRGHAETTIRATKLTAEQVQLAEVAFIKLGDDWQHILDAVTHWQQHGKQMAVKESPRLDDAVTKYLEWLDLKDCANRKGRVLSDATKRKYKFRIGTIFKNGAPNKRVADFTPDDIDDLLGKLSTKPSDKDTQKRAMSQFFSWCIERPRRWAMVNPCREVKVALPQGDSEPEILTIDECAALLRSAAQYKDGLLAPYIAVCLFAGLRPDSEAKRLDWKNVNLKDKEIRIKSPKTGRTRTITIHQTLGQWLKQFKEKAFRPPNWRKEFDEVRRAACLKAWPHDVMRHSAISYFWRDCESYGATANYFDNSEAVIKKHYQGRVSTADMKRFYALTPDAVKKGTK